MTVLTEARYQWYQKAERLRNESYSYPSSWALVYESMQLVGSAMGGRWFPEARLRLKQEIDSEYKTRAIAKKE